MKDNKNKSKRGSFIINLVETPLGYSVVEGMQLLNKTHKQKQKQVTAPVVQPQVSAASNVSNANVNTNTVVNVQSVIKQSQKLVSKQNNLFFLKSPNETHQIVQKPSLLAPSAIASSSKYCNWFDINHVSQIQIGEIKQWVTSSCLQNANLFQNQPQKLTGYVEKYKKHRDMIIRIYYEKFFDRKQYLSASEVRKYISDDANWLMKIHIFLTTQGIINASKINFANQTIKIGDIFAKNEQNQYDILNLSSSYFSKIPQKLEPCTESQNYLILKKATRQIRPFCDYCGTHCEMTWFQYTRTIDPKQIVSIMKNVNSKNPPLSQKQYQITLCIKCYCNGHFPLLLTHHDFKKVTVNDRLEPGRKKKVTKGKRKDKKKRDKQREREEDEGDYKEEQQGDYREGGERYELQGEDIDERAESKQKENKEEQKDKDKQKDKKINGRESRQMRQLRKQQKQQPKNIPPAPPASVTDQNQPPTELRPEINIQQAIQSIIKNSKIDRTWTFKQTHELLKLVEQYGQDWNTITQKLKQSSICTDCETEDIIMRFIQLPLLNVSQLIEQNSPESFVSENKHVYKSSFLTKKIQNNLDNSYKLHQQLQINPLTKKPIQNKSKSNQAHKQKLQQILRIFMSKIDNKINHLTELQSKTAKQYTRYQQITKGIFKQQ